MEMFNAGDQTQWETIKSYIDSSDYYLVVLAHRYGSKDPASGLSYTETEYDYAGKKGIPRLGFVIDKNAHWPANHIEADAKTELDTFKGKVGSARVIRFWDTADKLTYHVALSLANEISVNPRTGWVRATEVASPQVAEELARLSRENRELLDKLQAQPLDELSGLKSFVSKETIKFPVNDQEVDVSLIDVFLAATRVQDDPYTHYIHNIILAEKSGREVDEDNIPRNMRAIKKALGFSIFAREVALPGLSIRVERLQC